MQIQLQRTVCVASQLMSRRIAGQCARGLQTGTAATKTSDMKIARPWSSHRLAVPRTAPAPSPKLTTEPTKAASPADTKPKRRRELRPLKAAITLTPSAVNHLKGLLEQPEPKLIRIGVRNRGCSGLTYHLEYVEKPGKFDESIEQNGVKVLIDSKALFSVIGSEMDWVDDKLSSRFVFNNPNSKGSCGCGESFMV